MKAARLYGVRDLRVEEVEDPRPGPGEALIRVGALLQRITAAGWAEDLSVRTTLAPRADGELPGIRVVAQDRPHQPPLR